MNKFLSLLAFVPTLAFSAPMILDINVVNGDMKLIKDATITYEAANKLCTDVGVTMGMPWSAPKTKKVPAKVLRKDSKGFALEVQTQLKNEEFCKYKFSAVTFWLGSGYYFEVSRLNDITRGFKDVEKLEISGNPNSTYGAECKNVNLSKTCKLTMDGSKIGYENSNSAQFFLDLDKANKLPEIRSTFNLSFK